MNREKARKIVDKLRLRVIDSNANGIVLERCVTSPFNGVGGQHASRPSSERWRLYTGGGIAGNSKCIWLRPVAVASEPRGPFRTQAQLEQALRAFKRGE